MNLDIAHIQTYLSDRLGRTAEVLDLQLLDKHAGAARSDRGQLKVYGYGQPVLVRYRVDGIERRAVLRTMASNPFGHERRADRAAGLLLSYDTFNAGPRHVRALDVGVLLPDGQLRSVGDGGEFFLLTDYVAGALYADDLQRLRDTGRLAERDIRRAERLARYLTEIHAVKRDDAALYRRAIRDLIGSGEGIFGLTDSYPKDFALADAKRLERIEQSCLRWRWRLNAHPERLAQTHGDFHPFNVLFGDDTDFWLLDRSRGGWGEPADDVTCMAINYLFFSLQRSGELAPPFAQLWDVFWRTYLEATGDDALLERVAPFFVWRALVVASPAWYNVADSVRAALFRFIEAVLAAPRFDPTRVNEYLCQIRT
jgi:aminoglycoside phosphotransferase (APT) family kinase protein